MKSAPLNAVAVVETAEEASNRGPGLWVGTTLEIDEIIKALNSAVVAARDMRAAQTTRSIPDLKAAAEQIEEHTRQASILAKHLASVAARHMARRPRQ